MRTLDLPVSPTSQPPLDAIVRWDGDIEQLAPGYKPFWRPSTPVNRLVERVLGARRHRRVEVDEVAHWREQSIRALAAMGGTQEALGHVASRTRWVVAAHPAPADCWCGEVVMKNDSAPIVILYEDGPWTRLPAPVFEMAAQTGVDHMVGHLYPYFAGSQDFGEEVACRYQFALPLQRRGPTSKLTALLVALLHRVHKHIPLRNYRPSELRTLVRVDRSST
jgi:hypothetical protein